MATGRVSASKEALSPTSHVNCYFLAKSLGLLWALGDTDIDCDTDCPTEQQCITATGAAVNGQMKCTFTGHMSLCCLIVMGIETKPSAPDSSSATQSGCVETHVLPVVTAIVTRW